MEKEPWLSSSKLVVKPDMLFGKRGKSGLVALNLDLAQVASFVRERLGKEVLFNICHFYVSHSFPSFQFHYILIFNAFKQLMIFFSKWTG